MSSIPPTAGWRFPGKPSARRERSGRRRRSAAIEALEQRRLLASVATITNGIIGDNSLTLTVDAYGSYGFAYVNDQDPSTRASDTIFDAPGASPAQGTTRMAGLYIGGPVNHFLTANQNMDPDPADPGNITNASPSAAVSSFSMNGIDFDLTQTILPLSDDPKGRVVLRQEYTITNNTGTDQSIPVVRLVSGSFPNHRAGDFDDLAGVSGDGQILFIFDQENQGTQLIPYLALKMTADDPAAMAFTAYTVQYEGDPLSQFFPTPYYAQTILDNQGIPAAQQAFVGWDQQNVLGLQDLDGIPSQNFGFPSAIVDNNNDRITDQPNPPGRGPYVVALQYQLTIAAGDSVTLTTDTRFSSTANEVATLRTGTFVINTPHTVTEGVDAFLNFTLDRINGDLGSTSIDLFTEDAFGGAFDDSHGANILPDFQKLDFTDFTPESAGKVQYQDDEDSKSFSIKIYNDDTIEGLEHFDIVIFDPTYNAHPNIFDMPNFDFERIDIEDDDGLGQSQFTVATQSVREDAGEVAVTVERVNGRAGVFTLSYTFNNGGTDTATLGEDYADDSSFNGLITFDIGETSKTLHLPITDDLVEEGNEEFTITLSSPTPSVLGSPITQTVTIVDNDRSGVAQFTQRSYHFDESAGTVSVGVQRVGATNATLSVDYTITPGTATSGVDYDATNATLFFDVGETLKFIPVTILDDLIFEPDETINLRLSTALPQNLGIVNTATLVIDDNDPPAQLRFSAATYNLRESDGVATVTVTRAGSSTANAVSVDYAAIGGTATAGTDFTAVSGTLDFAPGQITASFDVPITNDNILEPNETILLSLTNPTTGLAILGTPTTAVITITDNDSAFQFSSATYTIPRNGGAVAVTIVRNGNTDSAASITYSTADGTAQAGVDYTSSSDTIAFAPGQKSQIIVIPIINDPDVQEPTRSFTISLSNASGDGVMLGSNATATVTIVGGPHVIGIEMLNPVGRVNRIERIAVHFDNDLDAATATTVSNYILTSRNLDGRFNVPVRLADAIYNPATRTVILFPRRPLMLNKFYQLSFNVLGNLSDIFGNKVVQGTPGDMGGTLVANFARGSVLSYVDRDGDVVILRLRYGVMELVSGLDGADPAIRILSKIPGRSILTGVVRRRRGTGSTAIASISNTAGIVVGLTNPPFAVASIT